MKILITMLIALLLLGCNNDNKKETEHYVGSDTSATVLPPKDTTTAKPISNNVQPAIVNTPNSAANNTGESPNHADLQSIIESSKIQFDEGFVPIATINLHNTTGRQIDEIQFRFTFNDYSLEGGIDVITANEYSTYVNYELTIKPPDYQTVQIKVPEPLRKNFDSPNIFITKVRYYDGTIDTDRR
jgi:hypothetical protein